MLFGSAPKEEDVDYLDAEGIESLDAIAEEEDFGDDEDDLF